MLFAKAIIRRLARTKVWEWATDRVEDMTLRECSNLDVVAQNSGKKLLQKNFNFKLGQNLCLNQTIFRFKTIQLISKMVKRHSSL